MSRLRHWTHMCGMGLLICNGCDHYERVEEGKTKRPNSNNISKTKIKKVMLAREMKIALMLIKKLNNNDEKDKMLRGLKCPLVEMIIRQTFVICKNQSWNMKWVTKFAKMFTQLFLHEKNEDFTMYMAEMYVIESAKICGKNENLPDDIIRKLFTPFIECMKRKEELHKKAKKEFKTMRNRITLRSICHAIYHETVI
ncbi:hypothetical protein G5I_11909 [Acromyrmex echinatior]|uniref:Uncharacterized protein n=1 Tax=Acromyrmex echinatior TaxID=103372 RepID=F4X0W5_ACREC|nr:hypothetical protein G5I_11909 [Acromyrmex echinatior]